MRAEVYINTKLDQTLLPFFAKNSVALRQSALEIRLLVRKQIFLLFSLFLTYYLSTGPELEAFIFQQDPTKKKFGSYGLTCDKLHRFLFRCAWSSLQLLSVYL